MKHKKPDRFILLVNVISILVAFLTHFPELITISNFSGKGVLFPEMHFADVISEVLFTYLSLLILFYVNLKVFHFNSDLVYIDWKKAVYSFIITWVINNLLSDAFIYLHRNLNIPAIDEIIHYYSHPLRDFLISCVVTGTVYLTSQNLKRRKMLLENQQLRTENLINQYESLKSQLNPHMLFNSLNTLYSLIRETPDKAQDYLQELSRVLRYTLQVNESPSVSLREEMDFVNSYIYLLQMRYEENLKIDIDINQECLSLKLPPMAVQLLIENAVKHNEISNRNPLHVRIHTEGNAIKVTNPIRPRKDHIQNTGIGLNNLAQRYLLLYKKNIEIKEEDNCFTVILPLI